MKKIILLLFVSLLLFTNFSYSQVKVTIILKNPHYELPYWAFDVWARVATGQTWRVGSSNIRVDFYTIPAGKLTCKPDNPAINANTNIASNGSYGPMTTTCINGGTAISLNIVWNTFGACYHMNSGDSMRLGTVRFTRTDSTTGWCTHDTIRCSTVQGQSSVVQDSLSALVYPGTWTRRNPTDTCTIVGIENRLSDLPTVYKLYDNYPNPFNPVTTIKYDLPKNTFVKLVIYDLLGKQIAVLVNDKQAAGSYEIRWDATNFSSGAYFCKMETDAYTDIKKMILVK